MTGPPALPLTSVPPWAVEPLATDADTSGRSFTVVAVGDDAGQQADRWRDQVGAARPGAPVTVHRVPDVEQGRAALDRDLASATVGWRLLLAGPATACLHLRAHALAAGAADDEITVASTETDTREVECVHCGHTTTARVRLEDVVPCGGCGRRLLVYYHVSRLRAAHLGFMVDAEAPSARPSQETLDA